MATSLNFDRLTVDSSGRATFSGLGSGIDIQSAVDGLISARRIPIDTIEQRISERETKIAAYSDLRTLTLALRDAVADLKGAVSFDQSKDVFESKQAFATSSRSDATTPSTASELIGVNVTNAADASSHAIEIQALATAHKVGSDTLATAPSDPLNESGTFSLNGAAISVTATDSLFDLRDRINAANSGESATGVTASLVSLSDTSQVLVLTADETGLSQAITLSDDSGTVLQNLGLLDGGGAIKTELQEAGNARILVDNLGTVISRESNTVDDVFSGVTLSLFKAEPGTTIDFTVERDLNAAKVAIVDVVDAYNEVRTFINQQALTEVPEDDETGAGVLAGTAALSDIRGRLSAAVGGAVDGEGAALVVLAQIGITFRGAGEVGDPLLANTLEIDETALDDALLNQPEAIRSLFSFELESSSPDVRLAGFTGETSFTEGGYTLNVAYAGGAVVSANIGGHPDGSDDGSVSVAGNALTVNAGGAKGMTLIYTGDASASGIQLDVSVGLGAKIYDVADRLTADDGRITGEIEALEGQNATAQTRADRLEERLEAARERELERFAAMEAALTSMNQLIERLRQQLEATFGNNS